MSRTEKRKKSNHNYLFSITCTLIMIFFCCAFFRLHISKLELEEKNRELLSQIEELKNDEKELLDQSNYKESDAYIKKIAREQLGLVMPNEIIYIDKNK